MESVREKQKTYGRKAQVDDLALQRAAVEGTWDAHQDDVALVTSSGLVDQAAQEGLDMLDQLNYGSTQRAIGRSPSEALQMSNTTGSQKFAMLDATPPMMLPIVSVEVGRAPSTAPQHIENAATTIFQPDESTYKGPSTQSSRNDPDELGQTTKRDVAAGSMPDKSKKKRKHSETFQPDPLLDHDDEVAIEQYKPRPSRSRAGIAHENVDELVASIDFSKRPEAALKSKEKDKKGLKRRKTDGGTILVHPDEDAVQSVPPPAAIKSPHTSPKQASKEVPDDQEVKQAEVPPPIFKEPEPAATESSPPKRKRGRPKKNPAGDGNPSSTGPTIQPNATGKNARGRKSDTKKEPISKELVNSDEESEDALNMGATHESDSDAQPSKKLGKKAKAAKSSANVKEKKYDDGKVSVGIDPVDDDEEPRGARDIDSDSDVEPLQKPTKGRKPARKHESRGRTSDNRKAPVSKELVESEEDSDQALDPDSDDSTKKPAQKAKTKSKSSSERKPDVLQDSASAANIPLASPTKAASEATMDTKRDAEAAAAGQTTGKHGENKEASSKPGTVTNGTGKVLYRVGLSKRSRVEPLLKIVRKT